MVNFLIYTAKVAAALVVFYLFFRLLLSRETFHHLNRIALLCGLAISFVLPLCVITVNITVDPQRISSEPDLLNTNLADTDWWVTALFGVFLLGAIATFTRLVIAYYRVNKMIKDGEKHPQPDGKMVVVIDNPEEEEYRSPSSWMGYIFLCRKDFLSAEATGLYSSPSYIHEAAHSDLHHSIDLMFIDLCSLFQWFNPAIWLLRRELTTIHEYEADKAVLDKGFNPKDYQLLLVRKAMSEAGYSVANNLNHSALKSRIDMMLRQPSRSGRALRLLVLIPLICIGLAMNTHRVYHAPQYKPFFIVDDNENVFLRVNGKEFDKKHLDEIDPSKVKSISVKKDGKGGGTIDIYLNEE